MIIYIFITVVLVLVAERRNNVQCDGKNLICFLLFLCDYLFHLFICNDTACILPLQFPFKPLKTTSLIIYRNQLKPVKPVSVVCYAN